MYYYYFLMIIIIFFKQNKRIIDCHVMEYDCSFFLFFYLYIIAVCTPVRVLYIFIAMFSREIWANFIINPNPVYYSIIGISNCFLQSNEVRV